MSCATSRPKSRSRRISRCRSHIGCASRGKATTTRCRINWRSGWPKIRRCLNAKFQVGVDSEEFEITRPVVYRYVERAQGELTRPVIVEPPVALEWSEAALLFPNAAAKKVELQLKTNIPGAAGTVHVAGAGGMADCAGVRGIPAGHAGR